MTEKYSVMVLPSNGDKILLQSFTNNDGGVVWDGFGSFYEAGGYPQSTAAKVFSDNFQQTIAAESLREAASLQYLIDKPAGQVDLRVTVYFANISAALVTPERMAWLAPDEIPYPSMHPATGKWLPILLDKPELLHATIKVRQPGDHTTGKVTDFRVTS